VGGEGRGGAGIGWAEREDPPGLAGPPPSPPLPPPPPVVAPALRRWIVASRSGRPRRKASFANSHRSGSALRKPYVLSWRTNEEKLLCLKCKGSKSRANSAGRQTMKLRRGVRLWEVKKACEGDKERRGEGEGGGRSGERPAASRCCFRSLSLSLPLPAPVRRPRHNVLGRRVVDQVVAVWVCRRSEACEGRQRTGERSLSNPFFSGTQMRHPRPLQPHAAGEERSWNARPPFHLQLTFSSGRAASSPRRRAAGRTRLGGVRRRWCRRRPRTTVRPPQPPTGGCS